MKLCAICQVAIPTTIVVDGKRRNLANRQYCLTCSPFGAHNTRQLKNLSILRHEKRCELCERTIKGRRKPYCQSCYTKIRRYRIKSEAVELFGSKCIRCGWTGSFAAFEFHHIDPLTKEFTIGCSTNRSREAILRELAKCELLCANCHQIGHCITDEARIIEVATRKSKRYAPLV